MKLSEFYRRALAVGIENDPRTADLVARDLERRKKDLLSALLI